MAKVIVVCGKICCGKSYYSNQIKTKENAVILSCDEVSNFLFDNNLGDNHDEILKRIKQYLLSKALDILKTNTNIILDWGFWTKQERNYIKNFFKDKNINYELHYIKINDVDWKKNIKERNEKVLSANSQNDYYLDEGLLNKLLSMWEEPTNDEIDVLYEVRR